MSGLSKVGLVLEGGGMRGVYTAGVLDCFLDEHLLFCDVVGVSAGACNAVSYISNQRGRNLKVNTEYVEDKRYLSVQNLIKEGSLFGMDFVFRTIPDEIEPFDYKTYFESPMKLTVVVTNCETGEAEYLDGTNKELLNEYLKASSSIPMFAPIVEIDGKKYLDGGTADAIPLHYSISKGNTKNVVVLTRNLDYVKKPEPFKHVYSRKYRGYPKLVETINQRHEVYNKTLEHLKALEENGDVIVIRPSRPILIGRFEKDKEKLKDLYNNGYEDAKAVINQIKERFGTCENILIQDMNDKERK